MLILRIPLGRTLKLSTSLVELHIYHLERMPERQPEVLHYGEKPFIIFKKCPRIKKLAREYEFINEWEEYLPNTMKIIKEKSVENK